MSIKELIEKMNEMEKRIRSLEAKEAREPKVAKVKAAKADKEPKKPKDKDLKKIEVETEGKKRGRKPSKEHSLSSLLTEGERLIARIPLGDRAFDEYELIYSENKLTVVETGESYDHPTTLVSTLAKILEDCGERSTDCSKSMNGWMLCVATRNGKKTTLEKLLKASKAANSTTEEETSEQEENATEEVAEEAAEEAAEEES